MPERLDTHMLECLAALVAEGHVSRAAARIGIGQPAMSAMLGRLRDRFGDPLLVRTRQGMAPTPRARDAAQQAERALALIRAALHGSAGKEPVGLRILALNSLSFALMPGLMREMRVTAPSVTVTVSPADVRDSHGYLERDECDLVLGYPPRVAAGLHAQALFTLDLVVIARQGHPRLAGAIGLDDYTSLPHVVLGAAPSPVSTLEAAVQRALRRRRRDRQVCVRVPDLLLSPPIVAATDLIATVPRRIAAQFARSLPLQIMSPPIPLETPSVLMIWHERNHRDALHRQLRRAVRKAAAEL